MILTAKNSDLHAGFDFHQKSYIQTSFCRYDTIIREFIVFIKKKCISVRGKNPQLNKKFDKLSEIQVLIKIISRTKFITASYKYECVYVYVYVCACVSVCACLCVYINECVCVCVWEYWISISNHIRMLVSPLIPGRLSSNRLMSLFTGKETWCCFT